MSSNYSYTRTIIYTAPEPEEAVPEKAKRWRVKVFISDRFIEYAREATPGMIDSVMQNCSLGKNIFLTSWSSATEEEAWAMFDGVGKDIDMLVKLLNLAGRPMDGTDFVVIEAIQVDE